MYVRWWCKKKAIEACFPSPHGAAIAGLLYFDYLVKIMVGK
jgi:hypothetical protein